MEKTILETGSSVKTTLKLPGKKDFFTQEAFKTLRTNLQFCGQDICTVVITSCNENEGKTTITLQLAKSLAELNKRVLVIDADMRKSKNVFIRRSTIICRSCLQASIPPTQ